MNNTVSSLEEKKYNEAVWIPNINKNILFGKHLKYSFHAMDYKINHNQKHNFDYKEITNEKLLKGKIVEVYSRVVSPGVEKIYKVVCRIDRDADPNNDLVAVIGFNRGCNKVITAWLNSKSDNHRTLNLSGISSKSSSKFIIDN